MADAFTPGARFGRYTLVRQLAVGGMAEIYLARIDGIGAFAKQVVLKRILSTFARSEEFIEMFLHEARLAAGLQHPNIVQVFDIGEVDGSYFFTMEYVQGYDLRSVLKSARMRSERIPHAFAIAFVAEAAAGLHHAHEQLDEQGRPLGIVHRDVSPSNIMVSVDGAVKVADFGIAKAASQTVETRTGTLKGKVSYMSPEQCRGDTVDRRSDVFALGIVLHELITGKKLFHAENDYAIIRTIVEQDAPRLDAVVTDDPIPAELERIVAKALARDRDVRYATAQALQVDLDALARELRLDVSSIARAAYLKRVLGTPPAGLALSPPTPQHADDPASSVPTTQKKARQEQTSSTAFETPASVGAQRRRTRIWGAIATAVVLGGGGGLWFALRGPTPTSPAASRLDAGGVAGAPIPADAPPPVDAGVAVDAAAVVDAGPSDAGVADAGTKTKPKVKPKDPCKGWTPSSMDPPPEGCDPTRRDH